MEVRALTIKNWCLDNITPQSWSRIVLRALPQLRELGLDLKEVENPTEDMILSVEAVAIIEQTLDDLYQLKIPNEELPAV